MPACRIPGVAIGTANATELFSSFRDLCGWIVDSTSVLLRYTKKGDANFNRVVNFTDLLILSQNYGLTGRTWAAGQHRLIRRSNRNYRSADRKTIVLVQADVSAQGRERSLKTFCEFGALGTTSVSRLVGRDLRSINDRRGCLATESSCTEVEFPDVDSRSSKSLAPASALFRALFHGDLDRMECPALLCS